MLGGDAYNVVPDRVELWGTVRTYKAETQDFVERRMGEIIAGVAAAQGMTATLDYQRGYPATVNAAAEARIGAEAAEEVAGRGNVAWGYPPCMGAEDFAFMLQQRPGSYIWMGVGGGPEGRVCHSPFYDFNDEALPIGVSYWARLVERTLPRT
jgi:hippurate hydrolase